MEIIREMERKHIEELLAELVLTCGFGTIISPITSVTGGFLHQMYKVITNSGTYAVKHLNTDLADHEELLIDAEKELNQARKSLPDIICLSNEDMDPKNVMWHNGEPRVIDLECLDHGNPVSHALQLALQWSGIVTCDIKVEKIFAFFVGYLEAYDNCFRAYSDVFGLAYTWVKWLEYNIQRALGTWLDESERTLGISEVRNTIDRIKYIRNNDTNIKAALDFYFVSGFGSFTG